MLSHPEIEKDAGRIMSIHTKIGILLFCAAVGIASAGIYAQHRITLPGFISLEQDEAVKNIQRVIAATDNEIEYLCSTCKDWSSWDDTYDFIQSADQKYIEANLQIDTFENNRLNLIYFCNDEGRVIWGEMRNEFSGDVVGVRQFPINALPETHPLLIRHPLKKKSEEIKGIFMTDLGPMLVAAHPILQSNHQGPSRGTLIMGRLIDDGLAENMARQTMVDYRLLPINGDFMTPSIKATIARINEDNPYLIEAVDAKQLQAHALVSDITGHPALLLSLTLPREISARGQKTVRIGIYLIIIASTIFFILIFFSLKRLVMSPLARLTTHALAVRRTGDYSIRARMHRNDEIGILAREFDTLLSNIEQTTLKLKQTNQELEKDMALRMETLATLRESEERFRAILDQAVDEVFLHDAEGRFRMVNREACQRLDYDRSELLQLTMADIDPDFKQCGGKEIWSQIEKNTPALFEARHRRRDGSLFPVEISLSPVQYRGEALILAIARDISDRKQLETQLQYAHKMDAVRTLTAGIAHNFNNILAIIMGSAELIDQSLPADHPARARLNHIETAVSRAKDIVWQLIHFSHQAIEETDPIDIDKVIAEAVDLKKPSTPENITVQTLFETNCPPAACNPDQARLMISNLWENAVEAMADKGGMLEVRVENIVLNNPLHGMDPSPLNPGRYVRITVADTGRGIDPTHLNKIFDPYFTTKDFVYGAGMGLAIVHGIVKANGGAIGVNSTPGKGTRVRVFFPALVEGGKFS